MSDRTQDLKNLRAVATACKNYTDTSIANAKEEIYWHIGEYTTTTSDDNTTASIKTVPANATRCKIKRIYGLTQKFNPTTAYDDTSYMIKTMPATVYDFDVSKVEGASEVSANLKDMSYLTISYKRNNGTGFVMSDVDNNTTRIRTESVPFKAIANKTYYINNIPSGITLIGVAGFDSSQQTIASAFTSSDNSFTTTSSSVEYIYLLFGGSNFDDNTKTLFNQIGIFETNNTYEPYYTGIHNFAWTGVKVEGANKCSAVNQNSSNLWEASFTFYAQPNTTYYFKTSISVTNYNVRLTKTGVGTIETYYSNYDTNNATGFSFTTGNIEAGEYNLVTQFAAQKSYQEEISVIQPMLNRGSTALDYVPYITPTTKTIDLSTILYNGSPLFEGNSLKGVGTAKDYITPYVAHKQMGIVDLGTLNYIYDSSSSRQWFYSTELASLVKLISTSSTPNAICSIYTATSRDNIASNDKAFAFNDSGYLIIRNTNYTDETQFKTAMSGVYLVYELATPIEVSIDWSSTLRGITGYSNGTITLQNTYNMDTANTITYNSIIKENCCAKIVQSRSGNVVKTINLPTVASDGYSAGSVNNYRDLTTSKRETNVSKESNLGSLTWTLSSNLTDTFYSGGLQSSMKSVLNSSIGNILCRGYVARSRNNVGNVDKSISVNETSTIHIHDELYSIATDLKTSLANLPLYYELADASKTETSIDVVENIIEVQAGDELAFYDSNDNLVTIPSDLTYRIEVAN